MEERTLSKLEYTKIRAQLAEYTAFACSRELAEGLLPADNAYLAKDGLAETDEARELLRLYPLVNLGGLWDIRGHLHHLEIGGILEPEALMQVSAVCRAARTTKSFFSEAKGNFPLTVSLAKGLLILKTIETAVEKALNSDGSISDQASERLAQIRRRQRQASDRVKERLDHLIKSPNTAKYLQEPIVTIREGRYVVPVKQEYRAQVSGVVHDMSASGATLFIEPMAVMEANNELQSLAREETEEIAAILKALSMVVGSFQAELTANLAALARLDFILAKGKLSHAMDASSPKVQENGPIKLIQARHPLIPLEKVVPIDVLLDRKVAAMVITGPNTGGKTVSLKTIGLLTLMAQAGLHIPAGEGSEICCFREVFADIGDEQSIEQSLSTFSSHMVNIVAILAEADADSLVLLDELGAGTDPTEGAALAVAILQSLQTRGSKVIATTHYSELKAFAYNNPGFINASVEFDLNTLSPTYRLILGVPGKSNAFEISRRLGLAEHIIANAADTLSQEDAQMASLLSNLEDMRREIAAEKEEAEKAKAILLVREAKLRKESQKAAAERAEALRQANLEAQKIIDETLAESRKIYEEAKAQIEAKQSAERAWQESRKKLKGWREQLEEELPAPVYAGEAPQAIAIGDYVHLPKLNQYGYVLSKPDSGNEVTVQVGVLKLQAKLADLRLAQPKEERAVKKSGGGRLAMQKAKTMDSEINLHGMDSLEAIHLLDKYLDDAFLAGIKQVRVNHGKGTGALRHAVLDYLRTHRLVKRYHSGELYEGGPGVTIVEFDL